jgi:transposase-like protein
MEIRIDWFAVFCDLNRRGISVQGVAEEIGVPKSTLLGWKQGAEPKHGDGERLICFWCRVMERQREALPLVSGGDWWAYHSTRAR